MFAGSKSMRRCAQCSRAWRCHKSFEGRLFAVMILMGLFLGGNIWAITRAEDQGVSPWQLMPDFLSPRAAATVAYRP